MMKKIWMGVIAVVLVMGVGTAAYAASAGNNNGKGSNPSFFERMLPVAKQMHPNLTDQQIKDMYNNCQSPEGAGMKQMMSGTRANGGMMNF